MTEFSIIERYFATQTDRRADVIVGIGDDAAVLRVPPNNELVITTDTLIEGVHFPLSAVPYDIGHKALAVNLSDLAAMGASPLWVTLALTLPSDDERWIQAFSDGFFTLANRYQVQLIGGDLTRGSLSITVGAFGTVPPGTALLRCGAKAGDLIYVTGTLGDAGHALKQQTNHVRLSRPEPRIDTGIALRQLAHAAIDISDGLAADLGHILKASQVGARVNVDLLPLSLDLQQTLPQEEAIALALTAGDDYELCFTVAADKRTELEQRLSNIPCRFTQIGVITSEPTLDFHFNDGKKYHGATTGYQHF